MKITYTGKLHQLGTEEESKLNRRYEKLGKLLDRKTGERAAHVVLTEEKLHHQAEIKVHFADHQLIGIASGPDQFESLLAAIDKLEKQILKLHDKRIDGKRKAAPPPLPEEPALEPAEAAGGEPDEIIRVNGHMDRKPMTLEEAVLEIENDRDYVVYIDAVTERVSVLLRQRDGRLALVEA